MNNITELKFKDEDGTENTHVELRISPVNNGYILEVVTSEEEWKEVYTAKSELLERVGELT